MFLNALKKKLQASNFLHHVATLMLGTGLAALIPILFSPVLTRLYTPADFGIFAAFSGISSILYTIACGRYELTILLPKSDSNAFNLSILSFCILCIFILCLTMTLWVFGRSIADMSRHPELYQYFYLLPITVFTTSSLQILSNFLNRHKRYKRMSIGKIIDTTGNVTTSIGLGLNHIGAIGLIIGIITGQSLNLLFLLYRALRLMAAHTHMVSIQRIKKMALLYKEFPTYSVLSTFVGTFNSHLPMFLFLFYFGEHIVGLIFLSMRLILYPLGIISSSVSQVFFQEISKLRGKPNILKTYLNKAKYLSLISLMLILGAQILPKNIIGFIFGQEWAPALIYLKIMVLWFAIQFITSSLSTIYVKLPLQRTTLLFNCIQSIGLGLCFYIPHLYFLSALQNLIILVLFQCTYYSSMFTFTVLYLKKPSIMHKRTCGTIDEIERTYKG